MGLIAAPSKQLMRLQKLCHLSRGLNFALLLRIMKTKSRKKPLAEQVIVITGASSGIGLATAKMAAQRGATVVLASRNTKDLTAILHDIRSYEGRALAVPTDVSKCEEVERLRDHTLAVFGRIDTWINNAGVSIYGDIMETPLEEERALFETNFWGVRHGSRVAVPILALTQGTLINVGSEVSERAIPLQGLYSASKHAVKAYTDALRMELEKSNIPVSVSLIRPAAIDTPFTEHARNRLAEGAPSLPAPVYHPKVAAEAILACAENPRRDVYIGAASRFFKLVEGIAPRLIDRYMEATLFEQQSRGARVPHTSENEALMHVPRHEGRTRGGHRGHVHPSSLYTTATLHPWRSVTVAAGILLGLGVAFKAAL